MSKTIYLNEDQAKRVLNLIDEKLKTLNWDDNKSEIHKLGIIASKLMDGD